MRLLRRNASAEVGLLFKALVVLLLYVVCYALVPWYKLGEGDYWVWEAGPQTARWMVTLAFAFFALIAHCVGKAASHPLLNIGYRDWLRTTPWRRGLPLPYGSPLPTWTDLLIVGLVVSVVSWQCRALVDWRLGAGGLLTVYAGLYSVTMLLALLASGRLWSVYAIVLLASLSFIVELETLWLVPVIVWTVFLITLEGVWRGLLVVPHTASEDVSNEKDPGRSAQFSPVEPSTPREPTPWPRALGIAFFFAWLWALVVMHHSGPRGAGGYTLVIVLGLSLLRWITYTLGFGAPVTLLGRLVHGRLIVPGYDKILVTPAVCLLLCLPLPIVLFQLGMVEWLASGLTVFVAFLIVMKVGPSMRSWQLTGNHCLPRTPTLRVEE